MNQVEKAICEVLRTILETDITSLQDFKNEYLKDLILFIDFDFFEEEEINSWIETQQKLENFLQHKGLDQKLDFNIEQLQENNPANMISAFIQIFAIMAIFKSLDWENVINFVNYKEKKLIFEILNPIVSNISLELKKFKSSNSFEMTNVHNNELKLALKNMEIKEKRLFVKEQEIENLKVRILKLEEENQKLNRKIVQREKEIKDFKLLKDEAMKQLEDSMTFSISKDDIQMYKNKIQQLQEQVKELQYELDFKENDIREKDDLIEKIRMNEEFYQKKKNEFEEFVNVIKYYKDQIQNLKKMNEVQISKQKIHEKKIEKLEQMKQKHNKCQEMQSQYIAKIQNLKHQNKILNNKLETQIKQKDWIKNTSFKQIEDFVQNEKMVRQLTDENNEMKVQIQTMMDLYQEENKFIYSSQIPLSMKNLEISEINRNYLQQRNTRKMVLANLSVHEKPTSILSKENCDFQTFQIIKQNSNKSKFLDPSRADQNYEIFYTLCMEFVQTKSPFLNKSLLVPNKENRKRDIFNRFTLKNILNKL